DVAVRRKAAEQFDEVLNPAGVRRPAHCSQAEGGECGSVAKPFGQEDRPLMAAEVPWGDESSLAPGHRPFLALLVAAADPDGLRGRVRCGYPPVCAVLVVPVPSPKVV